MERDKSMRSRLTNTLLVEEIAEMERSADDAERRNQALIQELRITLERGTVQDRELQHAQLELGTQMRGFWGESSLQQQQHASLHQSLKENDLWTNHLQQRADALVKEL